MDPQATLEMFVKALANDDADEAHEYGGYLLDWLDKGGFMPTVSKGNFSTILAILVDSIEANGLRETTLSPEYCNR